MRLPSTLFGASTKLSWKRLAEYLEIARANNMPLLFKAIDKNTLEDNAHPNAVLACAVMLLELHTRHTGRSSAQEARALEQSFDTTAGALPSSVWTPGN